MMERYNLGNSEVAGGEAHPDSPPRTAEALSVEIAAQDRLALTGGRKSRPQLLISGIHWLECAELAHRTGYRRPGILYSGPELKNKRQHKAAESPMNEKVCGSTAIAELFGRLLHAGQDQLDDGARDIPHHLLCNF
jgi:hypothetical protein